MIMASCKVLIFQKIQLFSENNREENILFSRILSGAVYGIESCLVHVEVDLSVGLPCFVMTGSLDGKVKESGERVRIALKNSGISIPPMHVSVNFSPADLKKEGTGFDLPVSIGVLTAMEKLPGDCTEGMLVLGELGLNGEVKPVKGVLPVMISAVKAGITRCLVAEENAKEAAAVVGMQAVGVQNLRQVMDYLKGSEEERNEMITPEIMSMEEAFHAGKEETDKGKDDFAEITGQESVKRAALIAAAGFHHMLIMGPPGSGKTMIAKKIPTILPPLSKEESFEVSSVYSISGMLPGGRLFRNRPFLNPHHTISPTALSGGGRIPKPGIVSLAHRGVLFLDELPEFKRQTLDLLRQPLEDRKIQIARSSGSITYPADFMLVGAMNPCPCGYFPDLNRCRCTPSEIHNYLRHISGPILDRIDLCVEAVRVAPNYLQGTLKGENSKSLREKVFIARKRQEKRYQGTGIRFNSELKTGDLEKYCHLGSKETEMLEKLYMSLDLSVRSCNKLLVVARTIADLEECDNISTKHLAEAVCYRAGDKLERKG